MLSNHLTLCQSVYKSIFIISLVLSCSQTRQIEKINSACKISDEDISQRHITLSVKTQQSVLTRCFKNYLKFQENKKQTLNFCNVIHVSQNGKVSYSKVFGIGSNVPNDFKMCLEQEYWMMNFSKLQLQKPTYVKFPLEFRAE